MKLRNALLALTATTAIAAGTYIALPTTAPINLATDLPPGALLTIESPNFAALLASWNNSPEQTAWLKSANYSAFSNSRLFSRLGDAQGEFEGVAGGTGFDSNFLHQIAGKESIFAWYDISKLEFLYISHLPAGRISTIDLLKQRVSFSRREASGVPFYVKTVQPGSGENGPTATRTIAFATSGDWLILGTREDLVANAIALMQKPQPTSSVTAEGWYTAAESATQAKHGDLHMLLDLQRIAATPAFRTYWIQRNVTDTAHYRAASVDLYRDGIQFREERTLVPLTPSNALPPLDLGKLESLVPDRSGVYRAIAAPSTQDALRTLQEKVLLRTQTSSAELKSSPTADLSVPHPGDTTDLETRIDTPTLAAEPLSAADTPLQSALTSAGLDSMMTIDRTGTANGPFVPIQSAVILHAAHPWDKAALQAAILTSLRSRLTVSNTSLTWSTTSADVLTLSEAHPIQLFVDGDTAILTDDATLMTDILHQRSATAKPQPATLIAAFHHQQERQPYLQLTAALASNSAPADTGTDGHTPDFSHDTVGSLSTAFRALDTERIIEHRDGNLIRQTVTYTWQPK